MSATLFKEVSYSLSKLIHDINYGEIGLPDIQRPFVWNNAKVRDLFDSMYKGFPVGYLLFWENGVHGGVRQIGTGEKQNVPRLLIVDGQQRLTSLYAVLKGAEVVRGDYEKERICIAFRPKDAKFEVADVAIRKDPEFIPDISQLWSSTTSRNRFVKDFISRLRGHREVSDEEEDNLIEAIDHLYDLQNYPFTALELSPSLVEEEVAEVFVRINSQGKTLNQSDFILTLMSVFWDEGRAQLEQFCRESRTPSTQGTSPFNYFFEPDPGQLLRVSIGLGFKRALLRYAYVILRGKDLETGTFSDQRREDQFKVLRESQEYVLNLQHWHDFFKAIVRAGFRRSNMITSSMALVYAYTMYLIGKRDFGLDEYDLRNLIARWFFMSSITGRYTGSPESVMEQDLARLRDLNDGKEFVATLDKIIDDTLTDDYWRITLPNELETSATRSPAFQAYFAALNLLDAKVLFSKVKVSELLDPVSRAYRAPIEVHHLFHKNYLKKNGITEVRVTNQVGNYALVEWADNLKITDEAPCTYYPIYCQRFTEEEMALMRYWHALPEGWENMDYAEFLRARRVAMAGVIHDGFERLRQDRSIQTLS